MLNIRSQSAGFHVPRLPVHTKQPSPFENAELLQHLLIKSFFVQQNERHHES